MVASYTNCLRQVPEILRISAETSSIHVEEPKDWGAALATAK